MLKTVEKVVFQPLVVTTEAEKGYLAQANTEREKLVATWQVALSKALLDGGLGEFNRVITKMIAAAEKHAPVMDVYHKTGDLLPKMVEGLRHVRRIINNSLLKPSISSRNTKLGRVLSFSVLPVLTCPDFSSCASSCYAVRMVYKRATSWITFAAYLKNTWLSHWRPDLVREAVLNRVKRARKPFEEFRLHVSGDVTSQAQADFWEELGNEVRQHGTRWYGYTKADVNAQHLLKSVFVVDQPLHHALAMVQNSLAQNQVPAVTARLPELKEIQKSTKGLVICPELIAKHMGKEKLPSCATCGLCSVAVNEPERGIKAIGFILH